jgi:membrane protein
MSNNKPKYSLLSSLKTHWHVKRFFETSVSLAEIITLLLEKIIFYNIDQRAAAVAYNFTLAVFPATLFFFTLIPYIPIPQLDFQIMNFLHEVIPKPLYEFAAATIYDIVSRKQGGVLSFGFILALITSTNGMGALMTAFNIANPSRGNRGFLKTKATSLLLTILLTVVLLLAILFIIVAGIMLNFLQNTVLLGNDLTPFLLDLLRYGVMFTTFLFAVAIIYRYAPSLKHGWRFFNLGAVVASLLIILATAGFSFYLSNFGSYNKLYGSIGTIIALMIWFYLVALLLIFGFELNVSIWRAKHQNRELKQK